jgi:transposase-like protein
LAKPLRFRADRSGSFQPRIVAAARTRFSGFDDKILPMYAAA